LDVAGFFQGIHVGEHGNANEPDFLDVGMFGILFDRLFELLNGGTPSGVAGDGQRRLLFSEAIMHVR
jgi:hypothetical protein